MAEMLAHIFNSRRLNGLHSYRVLQHMRMAFVFRDAGGLAVLLDELPEALSGERKEPLISPLISEEFKHGFAQV